LKGDQGANHSQKESSREKTIPKIETEEEAPSKENSEPKAIQNRTVQEKEKGKCVSSKDENEECRGDKANLQKEIDELDIQINRLGKDDPPAAKITLLRKKKKLVSKLNTF
jgi:hypothetical protein